MAPGAARWPQEICAPSKAGPVGEEQASSRSRLPSTISALVPTSTTSMHLVRARAALPTAPRRRRRRRHGRRCRAARRHARAAVSLQLDLARPRRSSGRSVASAKGAPPSSVGSMPRNRWCMIGLPTSTTSRMSLSVDAGLAGDTASASCCSATRTARGHLRVAARVHHHVGDAAHQVFAEADLRVHQARRRPPPRRSTGRRDGRRWWSSRRRWRGHRAVVVEARPDRGRSARR